MPSQRANANLLTADEQVIVQQQFKLRPIKPAASSGQPGTRRKQWTDSLKPNQKDKFADALMVKLRDAVQRKYEALKWMRDAKALPMASLEGAGKAAKIAVDAAFGVWVEQAVLTPDAVEKQRFTYITSGDNATLLDSANPKARESGGQPISSSDLAKFYVANDRWVGELMAEHNFERGSAATEEEMGFLANRIIPGVHPGGYAATLRVRPARVRQYAARPRKDLRQPLRQRLGRGG